MKGGNYEEKIGLVMGVNAFTLLDLIRRAAAFKGLKYKEDSENAYTETFAVYELDARLLKILATNGIEHTNRSDNIFTLSCGKHYWNFKLPETGEKKYDLRILLCVGFELNIEKRGFVLWPKAHGTFLSPADDYPHFRMFKALVDSDKDAPAIAKELAASDGSATVTWTDIGLGGIRRIACLFEEFARQKEEILQIARRHEIFNPKPYRQNCFNPGDEIFIAEPVQPEVIQTWREQVKKYRDRLVA